MLLGLDRHPFLTQSVPTCITFSKCVRTGKELSLSGSEAYQSIVLPITKATQYLKKFSRPPSTAYYFDCELVMGLAVIDAPIVGVRVGAKGPKIELLPWVRGGSSRCPRLINI
jgi:hypothetical protein